MIKTLKNLKLKTASKVIDSGNRYMLKLFIGVLISLGIVLSSSAYQSLMFSRSMEYLPSKYEQLDEGELLISKGFSRKQNMLLKLKLLSEIKPKPEVLFIGNHQLQYFGESLPVNATNDKFFNLWLGNLGITEIADVAAYLNNNQMFPSKLLAVMITTPNNDNGDCIVGYRDELPDNIYQLHYAPEHINKISYSSLRKTLRYHLDYKKLMGGFKDISINIVEEGEKERSDFKILSNGASVYNEYNYRRRPLILNENKLEANKSHLKKHHISEIQDSIKFIDKLALNNNVKLIVVIPPVYEDFGRKSFADNILTEALENITELTNTILIDHREFTQKTDPEYFYSYDHPSATYGESLYKEISEFMHDIN